MKEPPNPEGVMNPPVEGEGVNLEGRDEERGEKRRTGKSSENHVLPKSVLGWSGHEVVERRRCVVYGELVADDLVVDEVGGAEFAKVETRGLLDELDVASAGERVGKVDEDDVWEVHRRAVRQLEHASRCLNLRFETMRRRTKHHEGSGELADELLTLEDGSDLDRRREVSCEV